MTDGSFLHIKMYTTSPGFEPGTPLTRSEHSTTVQPGHLTPCLRVTTEYNQVTANPALIKLAGAATRGVRSTPSQLIRPGMKPVLNRDEMKNLLALSFAAGAPAGVDRTRVVTVGGVG